MQTRKIARTTSLLSVIYAIAAASAPNTTNGRTGIGNTPVSINVRYSARNTKNNIGYGRKKATKPMAVG